MPAGRPISAALWRGALALVAFGAFSRTATAQKALPVLIDSKPTGATVYLDTKDSDPLGQTPYEGKLEPGSYTIIVELDRYVSHVQAITVSKKKKGVQKFSVNLSRVEEGEIRVIPAKGRADVKGASVFIDGKNWGTLPDKLKVPAGPHQVEVKKEGFKTFEAWIEVSEGEVKKVVAELLPDRGNGAKGNGKGKGKGGDGAAAASDGGEEGGDDGEEESGAEGEGGEKTASSESPGAQEEEEEETEAEVVDDGAKKPVGRTVPFVAVGGGFELGGRQFRYQNPTMGNLRPYDAGAVPIVRLSFELAPLAFSKSTFVNGWTVYGGYARATPLESTAEVDMMDVAVPTTWSELDVGVGYKYRFGSGSHIGPQVGYGIHSFTFSYNAESEELAGTIPDVEYKFVWVGLDGRYGIGRYAILANGGTRLVSKTGDIGTRFKKSDVVAFGANIGMAATITKRIEARAVIRFDQYTHTFTPQTVDPEFVADGGTDRFFGLNLSAVFLY